jgi:uncharacterized iron-regulated membrane protein
MKLRTVVFWPHLIAGVVAGAVVLLMSITGVVLTYERTLLAWADRSLRSVPPSADAPRLALSAILDRVRRQVPNLTPASLTIGVDRDAALVIAAPPRTIYVDAYSGRLLGEVDQRMRRFMTAVHAWHRWLGVSGEGRSAVRCS